MTKLSALVKKLKSGVETGALDTNGITITDFHSEIYVSKGADSDNEIITTKDGETVTSVDSNVET